MAAQAIQTTREALGGHGYSACNRLGDMRENHDISYGRMLALLWTSDVELLCFWSFPDVSAPRMCRNVSLRPLPHSRCLSLFLFLCSRIYFGATSVTVEGDNTILLQEVAKVLLSEYKHKGKWHALAESMLPTADLLGGSRTATEHLRDPEWYTWALRRRAERLLHSAAMRYAHTDFVTFLHCCTLLLSPVHDANVRILVSDCRVFAGCVQRFPRSAPSPHGARASATWSAPLWLESNPTLWAGLSRLCATAKTARVRRRCSGYATCLRCGW